MKVIRGIAAIGIGAVLVGASGGSASAANLNGVKPSASSSWWTSVPTVKLDSLPAGTRVVNCWGGIKKLPPGVRVETGPGFAKTHPGFHFLIDGRCAVDPSGPKAGTLIKEFDLQWFGTGRDGGPKVGNSSCFAPDPLNNHCGVPTNLSSRLLPPTTKTATPAVPFDLYTHCGVNELLINGKHFQRIGGPLTDGSGNPPRGWGNPYQHGTLSISGSVAIFRDKVGHIVRFRERIGAKTFLMICS